jgi:hypothetical protein
VQRLGIAGVLVLAGLLLTWRIDEPVGGFHGFNEAHYLHLASGFQDGGSQLGQGADERASIPLNPPLYPLLLAAVLSATGPSVAVARLVSVLASLGAILATWLLARRLWNERAGWVAALLLAVSPVAVLTGRNIQTDATFVCLLLFGILLYLRARETGTLGRWLGAGAVFGLALFTKLTAAVVLPALVAHEVWERGGLDWLSERRRWAGVAMAALLPVVYYAALLATGGRDLLAGSTGGVFTGLPANARAWSVGSAEAFYALSPPFVFALAVALPVGCARARHDPGARLTLLLFASVALFYLVAHKHSYYLLPLAPFAALLVGSAASLLRRPWLRGAVVAAVAAPAAVLSAVDLASMKIGFHEFANAGAHIEAAIAADRNAEPRAAPRHGVVMMSDFAGTYAPVIRLYAPSSVPQVWENLPRGANGQPIPPDDGRFAIRFVRGDGSEAEGTTLFWRDHYGVRLFGIVLGEAHPNVHFFRPGRWRVESGGMGFGFERMGTSPVLRVLALPGPG